MSDTGIVIAGMIVLRQFCRNRNITRMTSAIASASVFSTSMIDSRTTDDVVERELPLQSGRKLIVEAVHLVDDAAERLERVGRRQQLHADARRLDAGEPQARRVVFGAQLDAADVLHAHERAVLAGLDDDVLELVHFGQPAGGADAELVHLIGRRRLRADRAGGDLHVLLAQRVGDVAGRQAAAREPVRIEPQPHREPALAEDDDVADAGHALQRVADVAVEVVADEERVVAVVVGVEADAAEEPCRALGDGDAVGAHLERHAAERRVHAVLHVDRGEVGIAADLEGDGDRADAVVGAGRGHVDACPRRR